MGMAAKPIYQTKSWGLDRPFYAKFKQHLCAICGNQLELVKITHYQITKDSLDYLGKNFRFDITNHPVDYTFSIFECSNCKNRLSINDQYYLEKPHKKKSKYYDIQLAHDDYRVYLQSLDRKDNGSQYKNYLDNLQKQKN